MFDIFSYAFMRNAVLAAILTSVVCGIIGTIIVEKKLVSMSSGIAHASFGGIGLWYLLGGFYGSSGVLGYVFKEPILGGLIFAITSALGISYINRNSKTNTDTLTGIFWSTGMALGIIFIAIMPGYPPDMTTYLFGDILTVSNTYIFIMLILSISIMLIIAMFYSQWLLFLFDEEYGRIMGVNTRFLETLLYTIIAISVVVVIKVVGIILVIALMTIPPAIARGHSNNLKKMMLISLILGMVFSILGLVLSYYFDIPSGANIIMVSVIGYLLSGIFKRLRLTHNKERAVS